MIDVASNLYEKIYLVLKNVGLFMHHATSHTYLKRNILKKDRVYYVSESVMKSSTSINKDNLLHTGTCLGKFTKSGKFRLHITALDYLAQYSKVS